MIGRSKRKVISNQYPGSETIPIPKVTENHFFWDPKLNLETIVGSWRRWLTRLFKLTKEKGAHLHRFRDSFAIELLLAGVPVERGSVTRFKC